MEDSVRRKVPKITNQRNMAHTHSGESQKPDCGRQADTSSPYTRIAMERQGKGHGTTEIGHVWKISTNSASVDSCHASDLTGRFPVKQSFSLSLSLPVHSCSPPGSEGGKGLVCLGTCAHISVTNLESLVYLNDSTSEASRGIKSILSLPQHISSGRSIQKL